MYVGGWQCVILVGSSVDKLVSLDVTVHTHVPHIQTASRFLCILRVAMTRSVGWWLFIFSLLYSVL